jgi:hypothetical protein
MYNRNPKVGLLRYRLLSSLSRMKSTIFFLLLFSSITLSAQNNLSSTSLFYSLHVFNSDTCCWRKLTKEDHDEEAAHLILSYYGQNKKIVSKHPLYWHAGQCFAFAGQNAMAVKYMKKTYSKMFSGLGGEEGKTWYYYAAGTVAFLERDKKKLSGLVSKWENRYPQDLNYQSLLELLKHWELPYEEINLKVKPK